MPSAAIADVRADDFLAMARGDTPFPDESGGGAVDTPPASLMQLRARHTFLCSNDSVWWFCTQYVKKYCLPARYRLFRLL